MASLYAFFFKKKQKHVDYLADVDVSVHHISLVESKGSYKLYIIAILSPMMSLYIILTDLDTKSGITIFAIRTVFIPSMVSGSMFLFCIYIQNHVYADMDVYTSYFEIILARMTIPVILDIHINHGSYLHN